MGKAFAQARPYHPAMVMQEAPRPAVGPRRNRRLVDTATTRGGIPLRIHRPHKVRKYTGRAPHSNRPATQFPFRVTPSTDIYRAGGRGGGCQFIVLRPGRGPVVNMRPELRLRAVDISLASYSTPWRASTLDAHSGRGQLLHPTTAWAGPSTRRSERVICYSWQDGEAGDTTLLYK